jgi:hypothetical protein
VDTLESRTNRKKTRRKRTTNLGPRLKVLNINPMDAGLKVECQMETAKQKTITFEFSTVDIVPDDISAEFVSLEYFSSLFSTFLRKSNNFKVISIFKIFLISIQDFAKQLY